ncbi:hypothetical protein MVEN_00749800 [Mycena venus]|uniref:Uncharacterized protein n=1 Tax=Mycena venus TaxID=2733690 RepID=A0A8H6YFH2_9AGAR|nr:hypothetical protein MVEN_00749800 [Mycena venus]
MSSYTSSSSDRPTLPPLHTLNLLPPSYAQRKGGSPYDSYERPCQRPYAPQHSWQRTRRVSTSTSSSTSRTPSPTPSNASSRTSSSSSTSSPISPSKLTLIPSSFEDADAVVVVPPPGARSGTSQSLLLTGPALEQLRHPRRQLAKGTRLHPYRFAGRRASNASSLSSA